MIEQEEDAGHEGASSGDAAWMSVPEVGPPLGERLRTRRLLAGLSLEETARRAGIAAGYCGEIERGRKTPSMRVLSRLAAAVNLSPAELLEGVAPLPQLPALDPRRPLLERLFETSAGLETEALRSLLDYAGYLSHLRTAARRPRTATPTPRAVPLFPDAVAPRERRGDGLFATPS